LIETDAPYLLPNSLRSKGKEKNLATNTPKNVVEVARFVGEILGKSTEEILARTAENGSRFFRMVA
jgi:Tat protein secretion system quality control protein TatD with DNase activity